MSMMSWIENIIRSLLGKWPEGFELGVAWSRDLPAYSGPRDRAFLKRGEVLVYDSGSWEVRLYRSSGTDAGGYEAGGKEVARKRAIATYTALTGEKPRMVRRDGNGRVVVS